MRNLFTLFIFLYSVLCFSQTRIITGRVIDSYSKEPIKNVSVSIDNTTLGSLTNKSGYFQFEIARNAELLKLLHPSYRTSFITIPEASKFDIQIDREYSKLSTLVTTSLSTMRSDTSSDISQNQKQTSIGDYLILWSKSLKKCERSLAEALGSPNQGISITAEISPMGKLINFNSSDTTKMAQLIDVFENIALQPMEYVNEPISHWVEFSIVDEQMEAEFARNYSEINQPAGGLEKFYEYLRRNLKFPQTARRMGVEGRVYAEFTVHPNGEIRDIVITKGIGAGYDDEVYAKLMEAPIWLPSNKKTRFSLPIYFRLGNQPFNEVENSKSNQNWDGTSPYPLNEIKLVAYGVDPFVLLDDRWKYHRNHLTPWFRGGLDSFEKKIKKELILLDKEVPPNFNGDQVELRIKILKNGTLDKNIQITKSLGPEFDKEAIRALRNIEGWTSVEEDKEPVDFETLVQISFSRVSSFKIGNAKDQVLLAIKQLKEKDTIRALQTIRKAIENHPSNMNAHVLAINTFFELGQLKNACNQALLVKDYNQEVLGWYSQNCTEDSASYLDFSQVSIEKNSPSQSDLDSSGIFFNDPNDSSDYLEPDIPPEFPGGMQAFYESVAKIMKYPSRAREKGIQGRVYLGFVVGTDGWAKNLQVVKGLNTDLDREAFRAMNVVLSKVQFTPGTRDMMPIPVKIVLPLYFKIANQLDIMGNIR